MDKVFSDFKYSRRVSRKGVNALIREIKKRVKIFGKVTFTPIGESKALEDWEIYNNDGKFEFFSPSKQATRIKATILNLLADKPVVGFILVAVTDQKFRDILIKEMYGYRIINTIKTTELQMVPHDELYKYCTTDFSTGENIPPTAEVVYCGPGEERICGWDIID